VNISYFMPFMCLYREKWPYWYSSHFG